jgi:hypothetical protein
MAGEITLIQGWNWYAGSDPTLIGSSQYDFQTTVTHELGHALGLGESDDPTSAMYGTLATGTAIRTLTTADLNIPYDEGAADPQRAALVPAAASSALTQEVMPAGPVLPAIAANRPKVVVLQSAVMDRGEISLAAVAGGVPEGVQFDRQPGGAASVGLLAAAGDASPPTLPIAFAARVPQPATSGAAVAQDDSRPDANEAALPSATALPDYPEPVGQTTTRDTLPSACVERRPEPGAAAADGFFETAGRRAGGLIRYGSIAATRDVAAATPLLLALLGSTWSAPEEAESRKVRRRPSTTPAPWPGA